MILPGTAKKIRASEQDVLADWARTAPEYGEFFKANIANAFERTTTGMVMAENRVQSAEAEAAGFDTANYGLMGVAGSRRAVVEKLGVISKEEWNEANPYYREGVEWRSDMTEVRARIYAEDYDKRQLRQMLMQQGEANFGAFKGTGAAFLAGFIGSMPDPINFIPVGGAVARGASLTRAIGRGALEGAVANAAVDALVLPDLVSRGADLGFADFALDMAFGGAFGALIGGGGYAARRLFGGASTPGAPAAPAAALPDPDMSPEARNVNNDIARMNTHGQNRADLVRGAALAVDDLENGRAVDVSPVLEGSGGIAQMHKIAVFNPALATTPHSPQVRILMTNLSGEIGAALDQVIVDMGSARVLANGQVEVTSNFGMIKFVWKHGEKSEKKPAKQLRLENLTDIPRILREYEPRANEQGGYKWIVKDKERRNILYVAKNFTDPGADGRAHMVTIHVISKKQMEAGGGLSKKIGGPASPVGGFGPSTGIPQGELSNSEASLKSAGAASRSPKGQDRLTNIGEKNINPQTGKVKPEAEMSEGMTHFYRLDGEWHFNNFKDEPLSRVPDSMQETIEANWLRHEWQRTGVKPEGYDAIAGRLEAREEALFNRWATEEPDNFTPAPKLSEMNRSIMEEHGIDPTSFTSAEEMLARERIEAGRIGEADLEYVNMLDTAERELSTAERKREVGLEMLDCIMGATE
ncbi:MAG: hypothetical protein LBM64_10290 [Deltaproteobacteria bacterium]|jgi:hypothetical protein|nr:hypothetical protein [Deltaproteobacteria bacterium]